MTSASSEPPRTPPNWPHCGQGATAEDPVGCRGIRISGHTACLAHLDDADRDAYLATLAPGADIDHRGTPFTEDLLGRLLHALRDSDSGHPRLGDAWFYEASFTGDARFNDASFSGDTSFNGASFCGDAVFGGASFSGSAVFNGASFSGSGARFDGVSFIGEAYFNGASFGGDAVFGGASFCGHARFERTSFSDIALFGRASFGGDARFDRALFSGSAVFEKAQFSGAARFSNASFSATAVFEGAQFSGHAVFVEASFSTDARFGGASFSADARFQRVSFFGAAMFDGVSFAHHARFDGVRFEGALQLGPLVCRSRVALDGAVFGVPVTVEIAAHSVTCRRTQWISTATLRLRYASLDLSDAVLEYPLTIATQATPFWTRTGRLPPEPELSGRPTSSVRLTSIRGVDAAHLLLNDIDLSLCQFAGAFHLDQLGVDGWCKFAPTPVHPRQYHQLLWRWSARRTLAEEHHWRAQADHPLRARGWTPPPEGVAVLQPAALAALYRQVRKSLEDGKNEPDAADFYYGEMEMRRHDATRPTGERALLTAYWALSGYGLRAMRAAVWLLAAMVVTVLALMLWGLPADDPKPETTGRQVAVGKKIILTTDTPDPVNPTGPWTRRLTSTERFDKSLRVVINSVVFRSSGQNLTTAGTYLEMASRITEPVLLGLAVLALRGRVKR